MPKIYVELPGLEDTGSGFKSVAADVDKIQSDFQRTISQLDWDVSFQDGINRAAARISGRLEQFSKALTDYSSFIEKTCEEYAKLERENNFDTSDSPIYSGEGNYSFKDKFLSDILGFDLSDFLERFFHNVKISTPGLVGILTGAISPFAFIPYMTSGVLYGNKSSNKDSSSDPGSSVMGPGYEVDVTSREASVNAWLGKASAETEGDLGYAGVTATLGRVETKAGFTFGKYGLDRDFENNDENKPKKEPVGPGEFTILGAELGVEAAVGSVEGNIGTGDDMLGVEAEVKGDVLAGKAEGSVDISVGEDGVNAYAEGGLMVAAAQGEASGTINILGLEIKGTVGGYAGAAGVEGEIGFKDGKFVISGGAAALLGASAGIEIGFNDEGWDNFVDFITFWD